MVEAISGRGMRSPVPAVRARSAALAMVAMAVVAVVALLAPDLRAQDTTMSKMSLYALTLEDLLKTKISTASLRPQEVREAPATVYVVTEEDFRAYGYRDLKDILRNLPGIDYIWPGSRLYGGQRGFSSTWELTKLLINGREANEMVTDAAIIANQFNLTGVKRVEIVQGPASVLYGPEAFSGVINIITKDAENSAEESELTGMAGGGDKSSRDGNGAFHTVAKRGPMALAFGGYMDGGRGPDLTDFVKTREYAEVNRDIRVFLLENGNPYRTDHRNRKLNADLTWSPMSSARIKAGALYVETEQGSMETTPLTFTNDNSIHEQTHFYASGEYDFATAPVKTAVSYHHMTQNLWNRFQSADTAHGIPSYLAAFNYENTMLDMVNLQVDYFPSSIDNYLLAGAGMRDSRVGEPAFTGLSPTDTTLPYPFRPGGRYLYPPTGYFSNTRPFLHQNRIYVYAQDQQNLWNRKIQITAGLRLDHNSIYGNVWNFRGGILLRPSPYYTIKGLFGQGFREPTVFDLLTDRTEPARMNTWEASLLFTPMRHLSGQVAYYQNHATDLIVLAAVPGTVYFRPRNVDQKEVAGVETMIRYQVGPLAGDLWHSYVYSIDDQPLIGSPQNNLGFGGHYRYGEHLSLGLRTKYTSRVEGVTLDARKNPLGITAPEYLTLDANALAQEFEFAGVSWDISFSIQNILDRRNLYLNPMGPNRSLAEGREYFGKVALRF
jgi:outer membrane receptor for ferrienterochelin and colicins